MTRFKKSLVLAICLLFVGVTVAGAFSLYKSVWKNGMLEYRDKSTNEVVEVVAGMKWMNEFNGKGPVDADPDVDVNLMDAAGAVTTLTASANDGALRIRTGTGDNDIVEVQSGLFFDPNKFPVIETEITTDSITSVGWAWGFCEKDTLWNVTDGVLPVEYPSDVLTSNARNFTGFFFDPDSSSDLIYYVAVKNDVEGTVTSTGIVPVANTKVRLRVQLDEDGKATFFANNATLGTVTAGAVTSTSNYVDWKTAYLGTVNRTANARTLTATYLKGWQQ